MRRSFALRTGDAAAVRKALDDSPANLIVCGDMNDVPSSHVYRVLRGQDLKDAWADSGRGYAYTYNRHSLRYRIDQVFYRGDVRALHAERLVGGSSDHYPLVVSFDIDNTR
jgi:endonuclease/exonuclease/phosphatase (EEP) superfamily protein YafD